MVYKIQIQPKYVDMMREDDLITLKKNYIYGKKKIK